MTASGWFSLFPRLFGLLPDDCRGRVEIKAAGAREADKWEVPSKGLPKEFATAFQDLYVLRAFA
jgi:hypothetical protein